MRVAGAPISWGVCEVPGWGYQLAPERVLAEMAALGLRATEFGPEGFLPAGLAAEHGLRAIGGFLPVVLHDPERDPVPVVRAALPAFSAAGARILVLAAATGIDGYDLRPAATDWRTLLSNLDTLHAVAADEGLVATLHPHVGTMVERPSDVDEVLAGSRIGLCLDTGHVLVGGGDPAAIARDATDRIAHVHLKDVDAELAERVRAGAIGYRDAVAAGLYRPLGRGDVPVAEIVTALEAVGYDGWYVLEQDTVLANEPAPGAGPVHAVRESLGYLASLP